MPVYLSSLLLLLISFSPDPFYLFWSVVLLATASRQQLGRRLISVQHSTASILRKLQFLRQPRRRPSQQPGLRIGHRSDQHDVQVLQRDPDTQGRSTDGVQQEEAGFAGVSSKWNTKPDKEDELLHVC